VTFALHQPALVLCHDDSASGAKPSMTIGITANTVAVTVIAATVIASAGGRVHWRCDWNG